MLDNTCINSPIVGICSKEIQPRNFVRLPQVENVVPVRERKPGPNRCRRSRWRQRRRLRWARGGRQRRRRGDRSCSRMRGGWGHGLYRRQGRGCGGRSPRRCRCRGRRGRGLCCKYDLNRTGDVTPPRHCDGERGHASPDGGASHHADHHDLAGGFRVCGPNIARPECRDELVANRSEHRVLVRERDRGQIDGKRDGHHGVRHDRHRHRWRHRRWGRAGLPPPSWLWLWLALSVPPAVPVAAGCR